MSKLLGNFHLFLIVILVYFAWLDFEEYQQNLEMKQGEVTSVNQQLETSKSRLGEIEVYKTNLQRSRQKLREVRNQILLVREKLPSEKDQTGLLEFLSDQADRLRLSETRFAPLPEVNKDLYFVEKYEVEGIGTFQQFLVYLEKMTLQQRVYNIDVMELRPAGEEEGDTRRSRKFQMLEAQIVLETYRFNQEFFDRTAKEARESKESELDAKAVGGQ